MAAAYMPFISSDTKILMKKRSDTVVTSQHIDVGINGNEYLIISLPISLQLTLIFTYRDRIWSRNWRYTHIHKREMMFAQNMPSTSIFSNATNRTLSNATRKAFRMLHDTYISFLFKPRETWHITSWNDDEKSSRKVSHRYLKSQTIDNAATDNAIITKFEIKVLNMKDIIFVFWAFSS